ncbi:hypothetical protein BU24DRAFT_422160 [Aaosphaeria arxii CBS 175.79]|uniref:Rhodopsin domain-containing protein n=1 Tax=Aaosphaeria arxii CBS 175.79 TaxID=1450172 RepID=A0A6A5XRC3_9PLEO|nr:uncharacterized protein BU24DRAFT_422160 [Aaosphaeria arxii CBS 175.79]KAF2015855.1 hypothetical protein BU24DRAFT_422160 [Aaosphaeria arxii CBS 175.79]
MLTRFQIFASAYSICQYGSVTCGAGNHSSTVDSPLDFVMMQQYAYVAQLVTIPALALSKISICLFYYRVFDSDRRGRRLIMALIITMISTSIPLTAKTIFQCQPIEAYWTEMRPDDKCMHDLPYMYFYGSLNVLVDIGLIAIVLPRVIGLNLNKRQKGALVGIVLLGWLAAIAGIVRMVRVGQTLLVYKYDPMWNAYDISIWTSTEIYVSLICAAAPGTKPLMSKLLPKVLGQSGNSKGPTRNAAGKSIPLPVGQAERRRRPSTFAYLHQRGLSVTGLTIKYGQYSQLSKGVDEEPMDVKTPVMPVMPAMHERRPSRGMTIVKKTEVVIERSHV